MEYAPKVSIVIPAYNASNYLAEAIDSALSQTYPNIEIIVVNDGSKDDGATRNVALRYGNKIIYIEKENGGCSSALNIGIANMTGEWFSWLSHDDLYYPQKIEMQIKHLNSLDCQNMELRNNVLFAASEMIDKYGKVIKKTNLSKIRRKSEHISHITSNAMLICEPAKFIFHGCSCLIHKDVFKNIGVFDEKLKFLNDVDIWYRIYSAGYKVHYLPMVLVCGRVHDMQVSKKIGYSYHNPEQDMFWKRCLEWLKENHPNEYRLFIKYGCNAYNKTRNNDGREAFAYARSLNPKCSFEVLLKKIYCVCNAKMRLLVKQIYVKVRMGSK